MFVRAHDGKTGFVYAAYYSRDKANERLEDFFASGEVSECELVGDWVEHHGGRWCILLKV